MDLHLIFIKYRMFCAKFVQCFMDGGHLFIFMQVTDTALRRRFDFLEMMPDLALLSGVKVKGIDIESLLEKLNHRIEALYDREHMLGHAFFMPVKKALDVGDEEAAFKQLKIAFQKKSFRFYRNTFSMTGTRSGWCWQTTKSKTTACNL